MRKFLKLVEENRPGEDKYTIELRDVNGELVDSFEMFGVSSPFDIFDSFKQEYAPDIPIEDQEVKSGGPGVYDVDAEVGKLADKAKSGAAGLAGKMLGTGAQQAKSAIKQREKVANDAIKVYKKDTQQLKQAIQQASA
jgi:hypothetical protein|tara:strand:+ start:420 stop:833 length:414 start_codon:yes stop_codon:yes gene_type:complete